MAHTSRRTCCRCGIGIKGKAANAYVAKFDADDRISYYTKWCLGCFHDDIYPVICNHKSAEESGQTLCINCGVAIEGDPEVLYVTLFPPRQEPIEYEMEVCPNICFDLLFNELGSGGTLSVNRGRGVGVTSGTPTLTDAGWGEFKL